MVRRFTDDPVAAFYSREAIAAMVCGCDLVSASGYSHTVAETAQTPEEVEQSRSVVWLWDASKRATFRPNFKEETISLAEFERRFESLDWCMANPDHPISFLRIYLDKLQKYLGIIQDSPPGVRIQRGDATAVVPHDATEAEVEEIFQKLPGL